MLSSPQNATAVNPNLSPFRVLAAALALTIAAFALYRATLLPGLDFGDTASLQTMVGERWITPRDGYPLYFAIGALFLGITGAEPAHALNLASAVQAALAVGLFTLVATELSGSLRAAAAAAALFAASYTFWSQAIIAEVYSLHMVLVLLSLLLLLRWSREPSLGRLAAFFACYALGFGNHLSMILLAPGYTVFLLAAAPGGWRSMLRRRSVGLAIGFACAGALQYLWNFRTLWLLPQPPATLWAGIYTFWFDVTKSDWRDTMIWQVPQSMLTDRLAMYWFDLRQQFGLVGPLLGIFGLASLAFADARRAVLVLLLYAVNVLFAFSYNVGDAHVFYLPSHLIIALLAAVGLAGAERAASLLSSHWQDRTAPTTRTSRTPRTIRTLSTQSWLWVLLAAYAAGRAYRDFPALDRSEDRRPVEVLDRLTSQLDEQRAILIADLNWQIANGLSYYTKVTHPEVAVARMPDVLLYAPALIADNRAAGRDVVLTERARAELEAAYGSLLPNTRDERLGDMTLSRAVQELRSGTRYVLCVLRPSRDLQIDRDDLARALESLGDGRTITLPDGDYVAIAGVTGTTPTLTLGSDLPFRKRIEIDGEPVEIRMESWLASDTIRRMGFGQVVAARQHTLIVERGVSFAAFDERGRAMRTAYQGNPFGPEQRYVISAQH